MKPLILNYAVERKGDTVSAYEYDFKKSLNTITLNRERKVFIDSSVEEISLITMTRVLNESSDDDDILELVTKTLVSQEQDDEDNDLINCFEGQAIC